MLFSILSLSPSANIVDIVTFIWISPHEDQINYDKLRTFPPGNYFIYKAIAFWKEIVLKLINLGFILIIWI